MCITGPSAKLVQFAFKIQPGAVETFGIVCALETDAELKILRRYQCDRLQGFLFSKPLPAKDFEALLQSGKKL